MNLKKNMLIKFVINNLKTVVNSLKNNYEKYHTEWQLTEDINWNTFIRIISNKQNSGELTKLPLKIICSVVFKYSAL